ncbi:lysophospholipase [Vibrio sp. D420a]|uniref:SGNH/GDSL hydrolase family protein n=1 Tax=Vibrio sp. D420a TaxID=2836895 RepID=UPI0025556769|nr:SGNH/GDSL hydrolase family protein [Vibrio sp. D420a]MDK9761137.1 lysophospholipase [Vibrio sp. D420a]
MEDEQLLTALKHQPVLDLYSLYQSLEHRGTLYSLLEKLASLKDQHALDTQLSPLKPHIEKVLAQFDDQTPDAVILEAVTRQSEIQQRGHSMSRYVLTSDNHRHFTPQADLVVFGDSITEWAPWADIFRDVSMVNRGLAGDTTAGMLRRIDTTLNVNPKLICFMAGINDFAQGYSVDQAFTNYVEIVDTWLKQGIKVVVQSTLFVGESLQGLNTQVEELNSLLKRYCHENGVQFLDVNEVLAPNGVLLDDFSCDDLHLNAKAYQQWSSLLVPVVHQSLSSD